VDDTDRLIIITTHGIMIKIRVGEIRSIGRTTQGVRLINLSSGDSVASFARVPKAEAPPEHDRTPRPPKPKDAADDEIDFEDSEDEIEEEEPEPDEEPGEE
jgi:DNA gyrase subunit A